MSKFRILSIDGGGIKGSLPAAFLSHIESHLQQPLVDYFDLIAGTSTGGIIALGLASGLKACEITDFYKDKGPGIFAQDQTTAVGKHLGKVARGAKQLAHSSKYSNTSLSKAVQEVFGDKLLGESRTRLVIPAFNNNVNDVYLFKTAHHPRLRTDYKGKMVDVALATAAAPTYFPAHVLKSGTTLIDGGIWANNPALIAVVEAMTVLEQPTSSINVLSLGCTDEVFQVPDNASQLDLKDYAVDLFMKGQSVSSENTAKLLIDAFYGRTNAFQRYNPIVPHGVFSLDDVSQITRLTGMGVHEARKAFPHLDSIFFDQPAAPFEPVYPITAAIRHEWDLK